jgi:hypothetical protein
MFSAILLISVVLLAGCASASGPVRNFTKGDELVNYNFSEPSTFEEGAYGGVLGGVRLQVVDGVYRISLTEGDSELWWGQWGDEYNNVVIDVDVNQLTERNENAYGIMCRVRGTVGQPAEIDPELALLATQVAASGVDATSVPDITSAIDATAEATDEATEEATEEVSDEATEESATEPTDEASDEVADDATDEAAEATEEATAEATLEVGGTSEIAAAGEGDGYLFLIQGTGSFSILRARGRVVTPLVDWTNSDAIKPGPAKNHLRAVCVNDYLAFYVNEQFVGDVIDDTYATGQVGLAASASNRLGVRVEFDNLQVSEATAR